MLGSAIDIHAPVDPGILERAAKRQDLLRGAKGVFGAGAQKESAGNIGPVLGTGVWQAGMNDRNGLEREAGPSKFEHDPATSTIAESGDAVRVNTGHREKNIKRGATDSLHPLDIGHQGHGSG